MVILSLFPAKQLLRCWATRRKRRGVSCPDFTLKYLTAMLIFTIVDFHQGDNLYIITFLNYC